MGSVASIRKAASSPQPPTLSPARQELAERIDQYRKLTERLAALRGACEAARDSVWEARTALELAEAGIETAKVAAATHLVDLATGTAGEPPMTIRAARAAQVNAEDELLAREAARTALNNQLAEMEKKPDFAREQLKTAALNVLRQEAHDIAMRCVERAEQLQRDLTRVGFELEWFVSQRIFPMEEEIGRQMYAKDSRVNHTAHRLRSPVMSWYEMHKNPDLRGDVHWTQVMDRLMADAAAPIA